MNQEYKRYLQRAAFAVALVTFFAVLRYYGPLTVLGPRLTFVVYYPAIMGAALYGGAFGGAIATVLVAYIVSVNMPGGFNILEHDAPGLIAFLINGTMISVVGAIMQRTRDRLAEAIVRAKRFETALDQIPTYIYMKDRARRYVYANRPTLELFGRTGETLKGAVDAEFFPLETVSQLWDIDGRVIDNAESTTEEVTVVSPDGVRRVYLEVKTPLYDSKDPTRIWGLCGISTDISERKQREALLEDSEARFRATFDDAAIGMALIARDGRFVRANPSLCRLLGYIEDDLKQLTFQQLTHPDDLDTDLAMLAEMNAGKRQSFHLEKRYFRHGGEVLWVLLNVATVWDSTGEVRYFIAQMQDISERKRMVDKLRDQANLDYLTGLNSRRHFIERGTQELARAVRYTKPLSLLMMDIDEFKQINDTRGHRTGDLVLRHLSRVLGEALRSMDLCGRLGGEEFAVLLPETDAKAATEIAERLRTAIAGTAAVPEEGPPIRYTISIGVAALGGVVSNIDTLLSQADQGLYEAKRNGRNRVCAVHAD